MVFQFQHKEFVWLFGGLLLIAAMVFLLIRWKRKVTRTIGDPKLVKLIISNYSHRLFTSKYIFLSAAFAVGVFAVMNPRKANNSGKEKRKGIDLVIALDVSKSMLAADLAPNRLIRAKQFINKLMNEMPDDRIGLVVFAGKAYLQMPLTIDHGAAQLYVAGAGPGSVPQQGTVISDALDMTAAAFNSADKKFKSVVLISDGEDHDDNAIATAKKLSERGVMINTVGLGSPGGTTIIDPETGTEKKDETGNSIISKLNEEELKKIAKATNGIYVRLQSTDETVEAIKAQLSQIDRKTFRDVSNMNFRNYFIWFATIMFVLLLIEIFIPEKKRTK